MNIETLLLSKRDEVDQQILKTLLKTIRQNPRFIPDIISYSWQLIQESNNDKNKQDKMRLYTTITKLESWSPMSTYNREDKDLIKEAIVSIYRDELHEEKTKKWE